MILTTIFVEEARYKIAVTTHKPASILIISLNIERKKIIIFYTKVATLKDSLLKVKILR